MQLVDVIDAIPELTVRARPDATLLAVGAADPDNLNVFSVADLLWKRGWYVDRQGPPASLHFTVNAVHDGLIDVFARDLRECTAAAVAAAGDGTLGAYGTIE
jgi:hypothetical protein